MTYRINGLSPQIVAPYRDASDEQLAALGAVRTVATGKPGFPCRITLEDAEPGEEMLLFNHISHDVESPYRSAYAIYVRTAAGEAAEYTDSIPPVFHGRSLAMRAYDADAMLQTATLVAPGEEDKTIHRLFELDEVAYIDVHNAAHGCFAARVERFEP